MKLSPLFLVTLIAAATCCTRSANGLKASINLDNVPLLALKESNDVGHIELSNACESSVTVTVLTLRLSATESLSDVQSVTLAENGKNLAVIPVSKGTGNCRFSEKTAFTIKPGASELTLAFKMKDEISLTNKISVEGLEMKTSDGIITVDCTGTPALRTGVALRQAGQDGVNNCRIPGLVTTTRGTLLAMYDARRDADRDLQGDIDICYNRSTDGGRTWSKMMTALDMGEYGGLPQKYNGVSDGSMTVDVNTGDIYVTGCWMHGVLDEKTGKFIEGLGPESTEWNHQWRSHGSQPGYDVTQSSQYLIARSTDDGLTWSEPENITRQVKPEHYWLMAPAPGAGITLEDGTLLIPSEGRDEKGTQFSTLIWSRDRGKTWTAGTPAYTNTNECMAVQLSDGSIMLNARERSNRGKVEGNGRMIATTSDLGKTWTRHPTSQSALIESACQASLLKHIYTDPSGKETALILFFNPSSISKRDNFTLKCSIDDGMTWPESLWIQFDCNGGNGYSCMSTIDNDTIGILYEGSGANLVFQQFKITELINLINKLQDEKK